MICALIQDNIVVDCPVTLDESQVQEYASRFQCVFQIDGLDPIPKNGWHYIEGKLLDPDGVGNGGIALMTRFAFRNRFTINEKAALNGFIRKGPEPYCYIAEAMRDDLLSAQHIDRSLQSMKDGMDFLVQINVITQARKNEILNNPAKPEEIYRGK